LECGNWTTAIFLLCPGLLLPPLEDRDSNTSFKKQREGEKQILIGARTRVKQYRAGSGNYKTAGQYPPSSKGKEKR
jgi:hypothetical protein